MKKLKSLPLCGLLFATISIPPITEAGSNLTLAAANYFHASHTDRALATYYALLSRGTSSYDYTVYSYLNSAFSYADNGYFYAFLEYSSNGSADCYYAQYYGELARSWANIAQNYALYKYYGYNYADDVIANNYYADLYAGWANYYLFICG